MATTLLGTAPQTTAIDRPAYSLQIVPPGPAADEAMQLRYRVFALEYGATIAGGGALDTDEWDALCEHLIVRDEATGSLVGTYRILPPSVAQAAGRWYSSAEFDLAALEPIRDDLVEVGRACVDPQHRNGSVIGLLWSGLARYLMLSGHRYVGGSSSIYLDDGVTAAASVVRRALTDHSGPASRRVTPRRPWRYQHLPSLATAHLPPLLRGYLRLGSKVLGEPAYDPGFHSADLYILLDMHDIDSRVVRRLVGVGT